MPRPQIIQLPRHAVLAVVKNVIGVLLLVAGAAWGAVALWHLNPWLFHAAVAAAAVALGFRLATAEE